MDSVIGKCVICFTHLETHAQSITKNKNFQLLNDQLNVIFVLENIFELKPNQLQIYMRKWGNPGEWASFCAKCEQDLCNIRKTFLKLNEFKRKFEKAKWELQDKVQVQKEERAITKGRRGTHHVFYECRDTFLRRRVLRSTPSIQNPFKHGDLRATELALKIKFDVDSEQQNPLPNELYDDSYDLQEDFNPDTCSIGMSHDEFECQISNCDSFEIATAAVLVPAKLKAGGKTVALSKCEASSGRDRRVKKTMDCLNHDKNESKSPSKILRKIKAQTNASLVPSPRPQKHYDRKLICPVCKTCQHRGSSQKGQRFTLFSQHFQECITNSVGNSALLRCSLCPKWSCSSTNPKEFMQHIVFCQDRHEKSGRIPWRHSVVKCNLCEGSRSCYLPFPDYISHINRYHQHKYGCSECPYRAQISNTISRKHWKQCHSNLMETVMNERFKIIPEGTAMPLPYIPWWCPALECLQEFGDEASRDLHLKDCQVLVSQTLDRTFECSYCSLRYFSEDELKMHRVSIHGRFLSDAPKCEKCDLIFNNRKAVNVHMRKVHHINMHKCITCFAEFHDVQKFNGHVRLEHGSKEELKEYTCDICQKIFSHKFKLRRHLGTAHSLQKCLDCEIEFDDEEALVNHLRREHNRPIGISKLDRPLVTIHSVLKCADCGIECNDEKALSCHEKSEHQRTIPRAKRKHPKKHQYKDGQYCCTWDSCEKKFNSSTGLYLHVKYSHREKQDYICHLCGKSCRRPSFLKVHIKHMHEKRMSFHCDVCGRDFPMGRELSRHQAAKHGIGFKCDVEGCSRVFPKENLLQDHKKYKHEGVEEPRPYSCQFCGKTFVEKPKVQRHELSMHINKDSRPFKCPLQNCEKGFPTKAHRQYHLKNTHKIENPKNLNLT